MPSLSSSGSRVSGRPSPSVSAPGDSTVTRQVSVATSPVASVTLNSNTRLALVEAMVGAVK